MIGITTHLSLALLIWYRIAVALIAYDCQDKSMNISTFSLTEIGECKEPTSNRITTTERIQLIQIKDVESISVLQCKIYVSRTIFYCGMHSHISAVRNGFSTFIHPVSKDMCHEMHRTRRLQNFYGKIIDGLVINGTTYATIQMAGKMVTENSCQGVSYEDQTGTWDNVIVQAAVEITLNEGYVPARINENKIILPGGITCPYREKRCIDTVYGYSFWEHVDIASCAENRYTVIYEGLANRISPKYVNDSWADTTIYTVDKGERIFAMPIRRPTMICGQSAYETDHPKFYIIKPSESGLFYFTQITQDIFSIDPTAYTNSKVVFVERHISGQLTQLYENVVLQKCQLEQQVLRNLQTLAITAPAEFAFAKMQMPGYTAVNYGEVVHIIQCKPVEVTIRHTKNCFHELPISVNNQSMFMTPRSHIIQKFGTEIGCNPFLYSAYKLHNHWYKSMTEIHEIPQPLVLEPNNNNKWTYTNLDNLFAGGLYAQEDMLQLQQHLLLPTERQAVSGILVRGMVGAETDLQGTNLDPFITEHTIENWFNKTWGTLWNWFTKLGLITSGIMGIIVIMKGFKLIIDTIIHGLVLYDIFGWSIRLIAAVFDSVTMYFIHQHHTRKNENDPEAMEQPERPTVSDVNPQSAPEPNSTGTNGAYVIPQWLKEQ